MSLDIEPNGHVNTDRSRTALPGALESLKVKAGWGVLCGARDLQCRFTTRANVDY